MTKKFITIVSWNVNGLRSVIRKKMFLPFIKEYQPDILCLQEIKSHDRNQIDIDLPEYKEYWNGALKKGYAGTAIFTKWNPLSTLFGMPETKKLLDDQGRNAMDEGRLITLEFENFFLVNVYTPNAKDDLSRLQFRYTRWDPKFLSYCKTLEKKKPVIMCGDFNVAHSEIDLARPKENEGNKGFTKEEREGFDRLVNAQFVDTLRLMYPNKKALYTWWSPWAQARERNVGWRIDYVIVSASLKRYVKKAFILPEVFGSDHCPVGVEISIH